jgi:hypothetical protein
MTIVVFLIPFLTSIILFFGFRKKVVWWEYLLLIMPSVLFTMVIRCIMISVNAADTEYLGSYVQKVIYYEPWNEKIRKRHEERYVSGRHRDGSPRYSKRIWYSTEIVNHGPRYTYMTPEHSTLEHSISKSTYDKIRKRLNTPPIFKDMHRNYHTKDGDAYITVYDGSVEHVYDTTTKRLYQNYIKAGNSNSIFKLERIGDDTAKELGLFKYPNIIDKAQNPIMGKNVSIKDTQMIRYINAVKGKSKQFRMYILCFKHDEFYKSEKQRSYWQNGNKNEFVVCIGLKNDSVVWTNAFSWCDEPKLEILTRNYFIENPKLDIYQYGIWLSPKIDKYWKRKEFKDFNYINIELTLPQYILLLILVLIFNISMSIYVITNNFEN